MNNRTIVIVLILICQLGCGISTNRSFHIQETTEPVSRDIAGTVKALREGRLASYDTSIPISIRPLLTTLKHQLRDLITLTLNSQVSESKNLENVRKAILMELNKQGIVFEMSDMVVVEPESIDQGYTYGDIHRIVLRRFADHPDLIAATTTIGVCCGSDTSLYLYKRINNQWKLLIAQETNNYEDVSGAQGRYSYAVSPPSDGSQFYLVTMNVNPWCSSNWQAIRYQVLSPGAAPYEPKVLLKKSDTIYLGNLNDGSISILPTGFTIRFDGGQNLDADVLVRSHVVSYQVQGEQVRRIPPFADQPESFLDEWFHLPWEEATKWISSNELGPFQEWHKRMSAERSGERMFFTNFVFAPPACQIKCGQWLIGIEFSPYKEDGKLPSGLPGIVYFTVIQKGDAYYLKDVSRSGLTKCGH